VHPDGADRTCPTALSAACAEAFRDHYRSEVIDSNCTLRADRDAGFVIARDAGDWQQHCPVLIMQYLDARKLGAYLFLMKQRAINHASHAAGAILGVDVK
jgi:hypothetical protein